MRLIAMDTHIYCVGTVAGVLAIEGALYSYVRANFGMASFTASEATGGVRTKHEPLMWCVLCTVATEEGIIRISLAGGAKIIDVSANVGEGYAIRDS
jgi:uncharacterized membrane protein